MQKTTWKAVLHKKDTISRMANPKLTLRNKVSHEYFGIDYEIIWDVAMNHLPENEAQIEYILEKEQ